MKLRAGWAFRLGVLLLAFSACDRSPDVDAGPDADAQGHSAPTNYTIDVNRDLASQLALEDPVDFEQARRGLIASDQNLSVTDDAGVTIWDQPAYRFVEGDAPASVNPSLWRQAKLNGIHGLFKVTDGIYQLRGFDLANMTLIEGDTGWIIIDPLTSEETAARALAFANQHLGEKPIRAILFTHSHVDHFGGVLGILSAEEVAANDIRVIAPHGFMEEATSENVLAGVAMARRADFMYGRRLARSPRAHVDTGLGKEPPRGGKFSILAPTEIVSETGRKLTIDGVEFVFQFAPGSEAPAEFTFYLPTKKAFCGAELVSRNMHNVYTLRGAKVRDALRWSGFIDEVIDLFPDTEIYFGSHHWPIWGNTAIVDFLEKQRDTYKFIHDQTVRMANRGMTPREIAEEIQLPESLRNTFASRGYYGTARHNAKAVYQHYFGWYDGNPANLDPLPPEPAAHKYVEAIGGGQAVLDKAQAAFDAGEYRWAAELLNHLVFAEPDNEKARALLARTYDQRGYQSESGPWRDAYLTAASELRHGTPEGPATSLAAAVGLLREVPLPRFFESMAARLDGDAAEDASYVVNFVFTDRDESYVLDIENAVLHHRARPPRDDADVTVRLTHELFINMLVGKAGFREIIFGDDLDIDGSRTALLQFLRLLDLPEDAFPIVTP